MNWTVCGMPANDDDELVASMSRLLLDEHATPDLVLYALRAYVEATRSRKPRNRENPR